MVKGTKRKATMERITKRESKATTFTKRSYGLHSKIAQLCLLTDAQIAVLATPPSANSSVSFFSFGHSSVDSIVNAFLMGEKPVREEIDDHEDLGICFARKELGLPQWWEDDALLKSKNPQDLIRAVNSISRLLSKVKELRADDAEADDEHEQPPPPLKKMKKTEPTVEEQTLVLQSGDKTLVLQSGSGDETLDYKNDPMTEEELDHIMSTCESFFLPHNNNNNESLENDFDQLIDLDSGFDFETIDSSENKETMKMTEPLDQPLIFPSDICGALESNNNAFSTGEMSLYYGIDIHQLNGVDFETSSFFADDSLLESAMNSVASADGIANTYALNSVACDDDTSALNEDDNNFSDYLTQFLQS